MTEAQKRAVAAFVTSVFLVVLAALTLGLQIAIN